LHGGANLTGETNLKMIKDKGQITVINARKIAGKILETIEIINNNAHKIVEIKGLKTETVQIIKTTNANKAKTARKNAN
jgi:hypothetical protein